MVELPISELILWASMLVPLIFGLGAFFGAWCRDRERQRRHRERSPLSE